jgi:hypothetical protein
MLKIGKGDALRFAVVKTKDGYRLDVEVVLVARPLGATAIQFATESDLWSGLADVALDADSAVLRGLQVMAGRERGSYVLGLAARDGQVGKVLERRSFESEADLRLALAEMAADRQADLAREWIEYWTRR